jgi:signal transduction histidine kinase
MNLELGHLDKKEAAPESVLRKIMRKLIELALGHKPLNEKIQSLEAENRRLLEKNAELQLLVAEMEKNKELLYEKLKSLKAENERLGGNNSDLQKRITDLEEEKDFFENMAANVFNEIGHDGMSAISAAIELVGLLRLNEDQECTWDTLLDSEQRNEHLDTVRGKMKILRAVVLSSPKSLAIEAGKFELVPEDFNLVQVLRWIKNSTKKEGRFVTLSKEGVRCSVDDISRQYTISADPDLTAVLFFNLIKNAFNATEKDVTTRGNPVAIEIKNNENYHTISIKNAGAIPAEIRECFFERGVTSSPGAHKGLGTHIAKKIVEAHGGEISSKPNDAANTTTIIVKLPKDPLKALAHQKPPHKFNEP